MARRPSALSVARGHGATSFTHLPKSGHRLEMYRMSGDFLTITDLRKLLGKTDKDPLHLVVAGVPDRGSPLDLKWQEGASATYSFVVHRRDINAFLSEYKPKKYAWNRKTAIEYLADNPDFTPNKPLQEYSTSYLKRIASFYKKQEQESILPFAEAFTHIRWTHVDEVALAIPEDLPRHGK